VHAGTWLVRIEDVDPPRVVAGAADAILRTLEACGFEWDEAVLRQSQRTGAYRDALDRLVQLDLVYRCGCSRRKIADAAKLGIDGPVYPGTCREHPALGKDAALRLRVPATRVMFQDRQQGHVACNVAVECGDFVLRRADDVIAYHLAVVVDDAEQRISDIVRGADLLTSTPRHLVLQQLLGYATPNYMHLPVVLDTRGDKLSKQTLATPVDVRAPMAGLLQAAGFLGMPVAEAPDSLADFWPWATGAWRRRVSQPLRGRVWPPGSNPCKS
jgi:glutamyl-Q tRNA(Asp) synthetase